MSPAALRQILAEAESGTASAKIGAVAKIEALEPRFSHRASVRFLRNYTIESIAPFVKLHCFSNEIDPAITFADFDSFEPEILDPASITNTNKHDLVVLTLHLDGLIQIDRSGAIDVDGIFDRLKALVEALKRNTASEIVVTSFLPLVFSLFSARVAKGRQPLEGHVRELNRRLFDLANGEDRVHVIDLSMLLARVGERAGLDARFGYLYRAPFKNELLDLIAAQLAGLISALKGRSKKVLVLDCDNTLWGGVVGEDGLEGIALHPLEYPGAAFYGFQRQILELRKQGILLALCSKNNEADVTAVFDQHPHSVLKRNDFAAVRINWDNKRDNLLDLARTLNLGIDSLVFVDDSAVECEFIRTTIPEVTVLQVPDKVFELTGLLKNYRGFDQLSQTHEDANRTRMYQEETSRADEKKRHRDVDAYLRSLDLALEFASANGIDVGRAAQLTQKTNQFNLTTRRYTEGDIKAFRDSPDHRIVTMKVTDRFGDYGITGVGMLVRDGDCAWLDLLLMSCRVLGRKVEYAFVRRLVEEARAWPNVGVVRGLYLPTAKNQQVANFLESVGFTAVDATKDHGAGAREYAFEVGQPVLGVPDYLSIRDKTVA